MTKWDSTPIAKLLIGFQRLMLLCNSVDRIVLNTLILSRSDSENKLLAGLDAVKTFIVARNACASFMGSVVAFWGEKSCLSTPKTEERAPPKVRSTETDNERTSALKSEFMCESAFANRTVAG
jgi:hypothetical protein